MSIWNKVLLGLNILVTLGAFYFALQTLHVHRTWRESVKKHQAKIAQVTEENERLAEGPDGNRALRVKLFKELYGRGRVWYGCQPKTIKDPQRIDVLVSQPTPHLMQENLVVYVFEYKEKGDGAGETGNMAGGMEGDSKPRSQIETARFLGEFVVQEPGKAGAFLVPTMKLDAKMIADLKASKGPWLIRELLPLDSHDIFADKSEEELRQILPAEVVDQYVNDGKKRGLRDYRTLLKWYDKRRTEQQEAIAASVRYNKHLEVAQADAKEQQKYRDQLNKSLQEKLAAVEAERDTVLAYEASLKKEIESYTKQIDDLMNQNRVLAQTIQEFQEESLSEINSRTASAR